MSTTNFDIKRFCYRATQILYHIVNLHFSLKSMQHYVKSTFLIFISCYNDSLIQNIPGGLFWFMHAWWIPESPMAVIQECLTVCSTKLLQAEFLSHRPSLLHASHIQLHQTSGSLFTNTWWNGKSAEFMLLKMSKQHDEKHGCEEVMPRVGKTMSYWKRHVNFLLNMFEI